MERYVAISYARDDVEEVRRLAAYLRANGVPVRHDEEPMNGSGWRDHGESTVEQAVALLVLVSPRSADDPWVEEEVRHARVRGVEVLPVIREGRPWPGLDDLTDGIVLPEALLLARARHLLARRQPPAAAPGRPWQALGLRPGWPERPEPVERVAAALLAPGGAATTGVVGDGGGGKTTVARTVCARWDISASFPGGLLWVDLDDLRRGAVLAESIGERCVALGGKHPGPVGPIEAGRALAALLAARPTTLVVLDDARYPDQVEPFLNGPAGSARFLVTTRIPGLLPDDAVTVEVGPLDPAQARTALLADLPAPDEAAVARLLEVTGGRALALRTANALLRRAVRGGGDPTDQAVSVAAALAAPDGLGALRQLSEDDRHRAYELSIFVDGDSIDLRMLGLLWSATGGLTLSRTRALVAELAELHVLHDLRPDLGVARLHAQLRPRLAAALDAQRAHAELLDAAATHFGIAEDARTRQWWTLPASATYLWHHLSHHLASADRCAELDTLLLDPRWAQAKLLGLGASSLDADFSRSGDPTVAALRRAVVRELPLLGPVEPEHSHADILAARLGGDPALAEVVAGTGGSMLRWGARLWPGWPLPDAPDPVLRHVLTGHDGQVTGVAIAPDGTWLASVSYDRTVALWDAASGHRRRTLVGHTDIVTSVAIATDATWLASAGWDGTVRLWDLLSGREQAALAHPYWVTAIAIAPDGTWLATASADGTVRVWDTARGRQFATFSGHTGSVTAVAASPDAAYLATGGVDQTVRLWDLGGKELAVLTGHTGPVTGVAIAPDATWLASAAEDGTVRLWDTDGQRAVLNGHTGAVTAVAIAPDATWLASTGRDRTVRLWDAAGGSERSVLKGHTDAVVAVAIAADGSWLATAGQDETTRLWTTATAPRASVTRHSGLVTAIAAATGGPSDRRSSKQTAQPTIGTYVATSGEDGTLRLWDAASGLERGVLAGHTGAVSALAVAADGRWLVTGGEDATVRLWDAASGHERAVLSGHTGTVTGAAIATDGTWFATVSRDQTVRLWSASGEQLATLAGHASDVHSVAIAPDGTWLATTGADGTIRLWFVDTAKRLMGRRGVAGAHAGAVLAGHATTVAIAPDGTWLATGGADRAVRLWDAAGTERDTLLGHADAVVAVAIAPGGGRLATASTDRTLRLWDSVTGVNLATMRVAGPLSAVCWAQDGRSVFVAGQYGPYRFDIG